MHFDIEEVIRQKQREYVRSIKIENGDEIDISIDEDGTVVVRPADRRE